MTAVDAAGACSRFRMRRFRSARSLSTTIPCDPDWVRAVVPRPLEPSGGPARVVVGWWDDEIVGMHRGGGVYLPVRLGDDAGEYVHRLLVDSGAALVVGREVFGETKHMATAVLEREGSRCRGAVTSAHGRIDVQGVIDDVAAPPTGHRTSISLKAHPTADGTGIHGGAVLTASRWTVMAEAMARGTGTVRLADLGVGLDPPGGQVDLTWTRWAATARTEELAPVADDEALRLLDGQLGLQG